MQKRVKELEDKRKAEQLERQPFIHRGEASGVSQAAQNTQTEIQAGEALCRSWMGGGEGLVQSHSHNSAIVLAKGGARVWQHGHIISAPWEKSFQSIYYHKWYVIVVRPFSSLPAPNMAKHSDRCGFKPMGLRYAVCS